MSLCISGATLLDGVAPKPLEGRSLWIEGGRIQAIGRREELGLPPAAEVIDARGKYVIPGLMNANVHLLMDIRFETLVRHLGHYEDLITEAAQLTLKHGVTTVFDTWGPRRPLMAVRDRINAGAVPGSRICCAGNIIGLDGPLSVDFAGGVEKAAVASGALVERINALWVENTGPALSWMTPEQVAQEVRAYIGRGIDFIKYASSEHRMDPSAFLAFSPPVQAAMVAEAHRAGLTAQAHTSSVEGLRVAIEAGCDLIQHCNFTGPTPIPAPTLELLVERKTGAVVFPFTQRRLHWMLEHVDDNYTPRVILPTGDSNCRKLIQAGAMLLLATDGGLLAPEVATDSVLSKSWWVVGEDNLADLAQGHFFWLKAMEEKGLPPMDALWAATRNIAVAYGKDKELGTLEPGKIADLLILDKDPLQSAEHYRSIHMVIKDGAVVDRAALPLQPVLTQPMDPPSAETVAYRAHRHAGGSRYPFCC